MPWPHSDFPQPDGQDRLPLPGPRLFWWILGVVAVLLPAALIVQASLSEESSPTGNTRGLEFTVRQQTLLWRTTTFGANLAPRKGKPPRNSAPAALPEEPTPSSAWLMGQLGLPGPAATTRLLFDEAVKTEKALPQQGAHQRGRRPPRPTELVVAYAVATRQDAVAAELALRINRPSADLRAALAGLPQGAAADVAPAKFALPATEAARQVGRHGFGEGWSAYLRDRVKARVFAVAGDSLSARALTVRLNDEDSRVASFFAALSQLLALAGLIGIALLTAGGVRTSIALRRGEPAFLWLRARFPGLSAPSPAPTGPHGAPALSLGTEPPYRTDPLVPLLGFGAWLLGYLLVALLTSALPGARVPHGFAMLLQSGAGVLIAHAVVQAFARLHPPLQAAARLDGSFWQASTAALRAYCALLPVMLVLFLISALLSSQEGEMHPVAGFLLDDLDPVQLTTIGLAVVVAAPVGEELLFRGFLYRSLRHRLGFLPALLITACLFAVLHVAPHVLLPYIGLGLAFGLVYEWVGSLWASIVLHALWNAVVFGHILLVAAS